MSVIYVDSLTGSDSLGSGSNSSPFKSIQRSVNTALPGDIIVVLGADGHIHEEPDSVNIKDKLNIKIQTEPLRHVTIKPLLASKGATFFIEDSNLINVSGLGMLSGTPGIGHANAVYVKNSTNIKIIGNEISKDWECQDVPATELFKCDNSSVELTGNFCNYIENSFPSVVTSDNFFSFISLSGNGEYLVRNCAVSNVHSNSGYSYGIKLYPDVGNFTIDDFSAENFVPAHVDYKDKMVGILFEFDNSVPVYEVSNVILKDLGYGLKFYNASKNSDGNIKRLLITDCVFSAILLDRESSISNMRNITIANCKEGIYCRERSTADVYNSIIYKCEIGMRSEIDSVLRMYYSVYYLNDEARLFNNRGQIDTSQFVRNIDPKFVNESESNYNLTDSSPCVDTGFLFPGDTFLGNGPDIGYYEKTALVTEDDLPSLLARAARNSEIVPLTEIDIIGMVAKGIETSDGRIVASREGSAVKDVAVKPLDLLLSPYHTDLELVRDRLAFSRIENLSLEDADLLSSNVFVERDYGNKSSGIVRIYFSEPSNAIIYAEHEFETPEGLKFYNRATIAITKDEMQLNYDSGTYYFDIVVDAEAPSSQYNLGPDSITVSTMPMPPDTLSFTNPYNITGGLSQEDNYDLLEKCRYGITVRDIVTNKGAKATLPELFPYISDMKVIGYRDPEMERDYIKLIDDHIGGKTDFYIKTREPVKDSKVIYPNGKFFEIKDETFSGFVPILKINAIEILEPVTEAETGIFLEPNAQFKVLSRDKLLRFSTQEHIAIEFSDSVVADYMPNTPFKVHFTWVPEMKALQSVIEGDEERVVCAGILAKCFEPAYVSFAMSYNAAEELSNLEETLRGFIKGIPAGREVQESDLVNIAYAVGATKVFQPMEISVEHHQRDGTVNIITSPDGITIPRIAVFWDGNINVNYLGKENSNG